MALPRRTFRLIGLDEGGVRQTEKAHRLVCLIAGGGKLAIWGGSFNRENINAVMAAGLPCTVECEYRDPEDWALEYGHTHWVAQDFDLRVIV